MKTEITFEDFLKEIHAQDYMGTDDDMPDAFDHWLTTLDADDFMQYADQALTKVREQLKKQ